MTRCLIPWFLLCAPNTRFQDGRSKTETSGCTKETVPQFSRVIGQSVNFLEQLHPNFTRFTWDSIGRHFDQEWLFSLDRVLSVKRLLHDSKL